MIFIGICIAVFLYQVNLPQEAAELFAFQYGAIPAIVFGQASLPEEAVAFPPALTLVTSMFLHGGWMHLLGNILYLWIFGNNIEDAMGHVKFLIFYLICGVIASMTHVFFDANSTIPSLGASGAIAGVLGAYLILHPKQSVRVLVPFGFFSRITELPAIVVIGFWALLQVFGGLGSIAHTAQSGVAYMAHVGGFVAGLILVFLFRSSRRGAVGQSSR